MTQSIDVHAELFEELTGRLRLRPRIVELLQHSEKRVLRADVVVLALPRLPQTQRQHELLDADRISPALRRMRYSYGHRTTGIRAQRVEHCRNATE